MGTIETIRVSRHPAKQSFFKVAVHKTLAATHHVIGMMRLLREQLAKQRSRMVLRELSDEQLRDIGKSRHEAEIEASRPFWR